MTTFKIKIVDLVLEITTFSEILKRYCKDFLSDEKADYSIVINEQDLELEASFSETKEYIQEEICAVHRKVAELLVEHNIIVFHSSALKVNGSGYLIAARSGTGKSTHANLLKELLGDKLTYINDDKPLLKVNNDNIIVYSSPWNGKERRGTNTCAPLKAIIFLNRGIDNTYKKIVNKQEIYLRMLSQIYLPIEKSKRAKALKVADEVFKRVNFYEINVNKDLESAKMTYERIILDETE